MAVYDCGELSEAVLTFNEAYYTFDQLIVVRDSDSEITGQFFIGPNSRVVDFFCSGIIDIESPVESIKVFISPIMLQNAWTENFLMGLAGIVCASLLSYVFVKYAV